MRNAYKNLVGNPEGKGDFGAMFPLSRDANGQEMMSSKQQLGWLGRTLAGKEIFEKGL